MVDPVRQPRRRGRLPLVRSERDILALALEVAARKRDPRPELIQHTVGTRKAATETTGSIVYSDEPSYLIAMRGNFTAPRAMPPNLRHVEGRTVSYPVQVLVVEIKSGQVLDSGGGPHYPDLASVGPVITDYRRSGPVDAQRLRRVLLQAHRRRVTSRAKRIMKRREPVELRYHGGVTVGSPGRARLHGRDGGLSDFIWAAIADSGWVGHHTSERPSCWLKLSIRLPPPPEPTLTMPRRLTPLQGGPRRQGEVGTREADGTVRIGYSGPVKRRAWGPGVWLLESDRRPEDYDGIEDQLYTAAIQAGWLPNTPDQTSYADIPDADIVIRVPRHAN